MSLQRTNSRASLKKGSSFIRGLVSKKKVRYHKDGYDLDLTYISDRIIAMGYPSQGKESVYRNPLEEVQRFFQQYHPNCFKLYNLCSERDYPKELFTDIGGQVEDRIAFDDHNPPPLVNIFDFCLNLDDWLAANPKNVAAIHCKAGKGRTGTLICCYLLWCGVCKTAKQAMELYGSIRTKNGKGVTIPSQIRFVEYFAECLDFDTTDSIPAVVSVKTEAVAVLNKIVFSSCPRIQGDGCSPYVLIDYTLGIPLSHMTQKTAIEYPIALDTRTKHKIQHYKSRTDFNIKFDNLELVSSGNIKLKVMEKSSRGKDETMFQFWIHVSFLDQTKNVLVLRKEHLDKAIKDKEHKKFDEHFSVEVHYTLVRPTIFTDLETGNRFRENFGKVADPYTA
jgi:phosphatidylinositol-3,4,5-trisphosphate 3-phosphatase/dual-specificity protein phosphatase PTEN